MSDKLRARSNGGFVSQFLGRQLSGKPVRAAPYLHDFSNEAAFGGGTIRINPGGMPSPPFAVRYNTVPSFNQGKWIAIGDEEGNVSIVDGTAELPEAIAPSEPGARRPTAQWVAHHNAIFDLAWFQNDERMLTGSGDQCVHLWDTASARGVGQFRGHNGSVKSVCPHASNPYVFASGARDGAMMVWDVRCPAIMCSRSNTAYQAPVLAVQDAHKDVIGLKGAKSRRRKYGPLETKHTVTSVVFLHSDNMLATSGDRDDVVKFWDMRRIMEPTLHLALPKHLPKSEFLLPTEAAECVARTPSQNLGKRQHGVTCLALSPQGTRLLVSCNSATHHMYDTLRPEAQPIASFSGHVNGSFYIRACFSPDGSHILSGSSDHRAYIWSVDEPNRAAIVLDGGAGEVTGVAWCPTDLGHITTCHDHAAISVWSLDRSRIKEPPARPPQAKHLIPAAVHMPRAALCADLAPARPLRIHSPLRAAAAAAAPAAANANTDAVRDVVVVEEEEWLKPSPELPVEGPQNQEMEEEGNTTEDRLGEERERVPLSALFGGSGQHVPDQAPGDNEASRHSFTGLSWHRASPDQAPSSQENRTPEPTDQNGEAGPIPVHPWAARVRAADRGGRAPLGELRGGFWEASQQSRERGETDPIDFSLLQDMEHSRGLGDLSQHFEATQQGPLRERPAAPAASLGQHGASGGKDENDAGADIDGSSPQSPAECRGTPGGSQLPCAPVLAVPGGCSAAQTPRGRLHVQPTAGGTALPQVPPGQLSVLATAGGHAPAQTPPGQLPALAPAPAGGRAPARTPPGQLLQAASMLCRERLSTTPQQPPTNQPPAETSSPPGSQDGEGNKRGLNGGDDVGAELACSEQLPSPSRQLSAGPVPERASAQPSQDQAHENIEGGFRTEAAVIGGSRRVTLLPPEEATIGSAVSVWQGKRKPLCDFLLSQYRAQQCDRSERDQEEPDGGTPPHGRPGPHPEDGFTDESPAPQPLKLTTPHSQRTEQEDMASISKRKAGNAPLGKQRSILDFFRTPPLDSGAKRRKENSHGDPL
ncbi:probable denticleless protein homolog at N-terminal half [Coccomyxa sp. Obi]|nr:probable denticleless protein homolog at N-terminal half [Coccomyxa sp. Obi]